VTVDYFIGPPVYIPVVKLSGSTTCSCWCCTGHVSQTLRFIHTNWDLV